MRALIDLQHPADLHFFRVAARRLQGEGHSVHFTGRDKDILVELARELGLDIEVFGVCRKGVVHMATEMLYRQWRLLGVIRRFKPDCILSLGGTYVASLGWLLRIPTYVFYDTEHATISNLLAYPFATCVYVPRCYRKPIRWRHERYNGYHELAYLHPRYFTPDPAVLDEVGVERGEPFSIVRFVAWGAVHDIGQKGLTRENKIRAVRELERFGRVFVSAEGELPPELEGNRLRLSVSRVHHLMAHAALIFGESATMPSEGAVQGVPGVYVNSLRLGYLEEQERDYGLIANFTPDRQEEAIDRACAWLTDYDRQRWRSRGEQLVADKIDVCEFICQVARQRPYSRPLVDSKAAST
jgi:predicted glycosyltransferase